MTSQQKRLDIIAKNRWFASEFSHDIHITLWQFNIAIEHGHL